VWQMVHPQWRLILRRPCTNAAVHQRTASRQGSWSTSVDCAARSRSGPESRAAIVAMQWPTRWGHRSKRRSPRCRCVTGSQRDDLARQVVSLSEFWLHRLTDAAHVGRFGDPIAGRYGQSVTCGMSAAWGQRAEHDHGSFRGQLLQFDQVGDAARPGHLHVQRDDIIRC